MHYFVCGSLFCFTLLVYHFTLTNYFIVFIIFLLYLYNLYVLFL